MRGIFYLSGFCIYLLCGIVISVWQYRKPRKNRKIYAFLTFAIFLLLPFADYFIQLFLIQSRTMFRPPLQEIHNVIESPLSVYWEDNVWPGFDEYGRDWMVKKYLDGKHLQILALNGDDGKIYLYKHNVEEAQQLNSKSDLPPMNYQVKLDKTPLLFFERPFLWADKIEVISQENDEVIGYSKRYCGYGWWLGYYPIGDFAKGYVKGDVRVYEFDDKVLFSYAGVKGGLDRMKNRFRKKSYNLDAIDWKENKRLGD